MGLFGRGSDDGAAIAAAPVAPPHPALASLEAFAAASLTEAATAVLRLAFNGDAPGSEVLQSQLTLRAQDLLGPATGLRGMDLLRHFQDRQLTLVLNEAIAVLGRSLLVELHHGTSATPYVILTRRGRRALDSGAPERWVDVPADPI